MDVFQLHPAYVTVFVIFALAWSWLIYRNGLRGLLFGLFIIGFIALLRAGAWVTHELWGQAGAVIFVITFFACVFAFVQWNTTRRKRQENKIGHHEA